MTDQRFWWAHLRVPLFAFAALAVLCEWTTLDGAIAHTFFYDESRHAWLGANSWWVNQFLHTRGRWAIRCIVTLSLLAWVATFFDAGLRSLRRASAYVCIGMIASVTAVGLLKTLTNVDCPWDLAQFGGNYPWVGLFSDRPDLLRQGRCFPAAHASSGYALMALYFAFRERHRTLARCGLALGIATGFTFGVAQQARGAHFLSHDVWSAFIVWLILLSIYVFAFRRRLYSTVAAPSAETTAARRPCGKMRIYGIARGRIHCGRGGREPEGAQAIWRAPEKWRTMQPIRRETSNDAKHRNDGRARCSNRKIRCAAGLLARRRYRGVYGPAPASGHACLADIVREPRG